MTKFRGILLFLNSYPHGLAVLSGGLEAFKIRQLHVNKQQIETEIAKGISLCYPPN